MKIPLPLLKVRAALAVTTLSLAGITSASALSGTLAFPALYPGNIDSSGTFGNGYIALDSGGNLLENSAFQHIVVKYDTHGNLLWTANVNNISLNSGRIVVDSGNNIYVSGVNQPGSTNMVFGVEKISPSGAILWSTNYILGALGLGNEHGAGGPMVLGNNGSLYIACHSANFSQNNAPLFIVRVNTSNGALQKAVQMGKTLDSSSPSMSDSALARDSANNVFYGDPSGTFSYSSDLGTLRWNNSTTSTNNLPYSVRAIICDSANNVYVTGTAPTSGAYVMITKRLNNANGTTVWASANYVGENLGLGTYPVAGSPFDFLFGGNALALDSAGMLYAVGGAQDGSGYVGGVLAKYNPSTGAVLWSRQTTFSDFDGASADVAIDNNNNIHVAGMDGDGSAAGHATINVFDTLGNLLWNASTQFTLNTDNQMAKVALDNNGGVWVVDELINKSASPIVAKYAETGGGGGTVPNGTYKIINLNSALAMEAFGQHTTNGTQIDQWAYNTGFNQQWTVTSLGNGQYSIIGSQSGRSLDVAGSGTANGTKVELWDHNGGVNQQYSFTPTANGYYRITPANATLSCIEGVGLSKANGTLVDLWQYNGGNNQQWIFLGP